MKDYSYLKDNTVVSPDRLAVIEKLANEASLLFGTGIGVEVGVYKGGTAHLICHAFHDKLVELYDTFEGLPDTGVIDLHRKGDFNDTSIEHVNKVLKDFNNYSLIKGVFPESANNQWLIAFAHIDVDLYQSMLNCLENIYKRTIPGGIIVMDDYLAPSCPGATKAIEEFFADKPEVLQSDAKYQAYIIKGWANE